MNKLLAALMCLFFTCIGIAQENSGKPIDSTAYYLELAQFNARINNYKNSLENTQKAIDYARRIKDVRAEASASLSIGVIYLELDKFNDAIEILTRSIALFNTLKPSSEQAFAYYNLGLVYMEKENYSMAESNFEKAKTIYSGLQIPDAIALLDLQKGKVYRVKGKTNEAVIIFSGLISNAEKQDDYRVKPEALYELGVIESQRNRSVIALNYLNRALAQNMQQGANLELRARIFKALSSAYEDIGNIPKSLEFLKKHLEVSDANAALNRDKLGADDYAKFKENEKLKMIDQLKQDREQQEKTTKFSKLITILAIALISILSLLSLSLYKNNIIRNQSNAVLKEKNRELQIAKDKAEKASKARAEFLSTVSHELRTPLNAINGITHLLLEENPKKSQLNYLSSLQFSGNYLLTFINEILEFNRIESNNVVAENINFNLKLLLENIQSSLKEFAAANSNKYTIEIDPSIPDILVGDPTKLSQIFMNLINNALKFTQNGEVRVIASQLALENGTSTLRFEVIDTGIGIPEDRQEAIFDSFAQGSIEINRKYGGTGLGLNIVKRLVEILGGSIGLESRIGQGSTFFFSLQFKVSSGQPLVVNDDYDESVFTNKKVLLIEDNKINQMITAKMCENKLMLVEIIDNGEDAIEAVKNNYYDLVLMDVHLPGINGTIATQTIRTFDQHTRIIALTAISLNENREMLLSYGMNDVITKPFDPNDFYRIIAQNLS